MLTKMHLFSRAYWKSAAGEVKNLRRLTFAALTVALCIVISSMFIPVGENLRVYFKFLVSSIGCAVCGPVLSLLIGAVSDTLGFIIHPSGAYFPGYLLSEVLGCLIYALLLYRQQITILRLLIAKLLINVFVNIGLGSLWSAILYAKGYYYYFAKSVVKNLLLLPIEVVLMSLLFTLLIPVLERLSMVVPHKGKMIVPWF